ncbi:T9SS type A sorting domain-containing protein [Longitalea arenae]|uniref:T9SS type A sorting domain-containing protein n=1 Tax=Longitalea arenae TaxID=2812558 RepID=UPI001966D56D|nr:T9SS type A sorting domain-containing protein [Longitalea arenae]
MKNFYTFFCKIYVLICLTKSSKLLLSFRNQQNFRPKKVLLPAFQFLFLCFVNIQANSQTLDWSSSFSPAWTDGSVSGTATNVSGFGTNVSVSVNNSQAGTYQQVTTGVNAPAVNTNNGRSNFFILAGTTDALEIDVNWTSNTAYVDVIYNFSQPVYNLSFRVGDIDKAGPSSTTYFDRVTITGQNGATAVLPQTITPVNASGNYIVISGNVVHANTTAGVGGNANTNSTATSSQQGTAEISFASQAVTQVTVRYDNHPSSQANPALQAIAIGNMSWLSAPLPVDLISFVGKAVDDNAWLKWKVENQVNFEQYEIEYSPLDSNHYTVVGKVYSNNQSAGTYEFTHLNANSYGNVGYYRLKMIDRDGSYKYSRIVSVRFKDGTNVNVRPTIMSKGEVIHITVTSPLSNYGVKIVNTNGQLVESKTMNGTGLQIETSKYKAGTYFIQIEGLAVRRIYKVLIQ